MPGENRKENREVQKMATVNKMEVTSADIRQYCTTLEPGTVGKYVLLPGDPARSNRAAKYLEDAELVAESREFRTFTGYFEGIKMSVTSTGIGCPSASIATEELANIGAECFIRIGSTAAIEPSYRVGDLLISTGAMKNEGTSRFYVPDSFPAVPDLELTWMLLSQAKEEMEGTDVAVHAGIGTTDDSFFGETPEFIDRVAGYGCVNLDMEASGIFTAAIHRRKRAAAIYSVSANLRSGEIYYADGTKEKDNEKLAAGWEHEILIALKTFARFDRMEKHLY